MHVQLVASEVRNDGVKEERNAADSPKGLYEYTKRSPASSVATIATEPPSTMNSVAWISSGLKSLLRRASLGGSICNERHSEARIRHLEDLWRFKQPGQRKP